MAVIADATALFFWFLPMLLLYTYAKCKTDNDNEKWVDLTIDLYD